MDKKIKELLHRYPITAAYSEEDACFVARVIGFRNLAAHGDTHEESVREARIALTGALKVMLAHGRELPAPDPILDELRALRPLLNLARLSKAAGIPRTTLTSRLEHGTRFTHAEAGRIHRALAGIAVA